MKKQTVFDFMYKKHPNHKYTNEQKEEWVILYKQGKSFREIGAIAETPFSTVSWYVNKKLGAKDSRKAGRKKIHTGLNHKEVTKQWHMLKAYGITLEQYDDLLKIQKGLCAICDKPPLGGKTSTASLHVDHDHITGKIRGLLCHKCNPAIGQFSDSIEKLERAIAYLRKS